MFFHSMGDFEEFPAVYLLFRCVIGGGLFLAMQGDIHSGGQKFSGKSRVDDQLSFGERGVRFSAYGVEALASAGSGIGGRRLG